MFAKPNHHKVFSICANEPEDDDEEQTSENTYEAGPNVLYLSGPISSETIDAAVSFIVHHNFLAEHDRIVIFINSPGGALHHGFALVSAIRASIIPVFTVALGECDSAGLIIAMAGDLRLVAPSCSILSHQYSAAQGLSKYNDLVAKQKDLKMTAERVIDHYVKCTELSVKEVKRHLVNEHDVFLNAEEAIKYNLFDDYFVSFDQLFFEFSNDEEPVNADAK